MLERLGCDWRTGHDGRWCSMYGRLKKYKYEHGDVSIAKSYVTDDGVKLGRWLYEQVRICRTGDYDAEYKKLLSELG